MLAWSLAVLIQIAGPDSAPTPTLRHFKEDHLTGAGYLRLSSSGTYEVIGREHMGIWKLDYGTWSAKANSWSFASVENAGAKFSCRAVQTAGRTFLVWKGKDAPGIEMPEAQVRADLRKAPKITPPYVFFEISQEVFDRETQERYPFKFYPEMNKTP
jgi:hypothetical protein